VALQYFLTTVLYTLSHIIPHRIVVDKVALGQTFSSYCTFVSITASVLHNLSTWQHHYGNKNRSPCYFHIMWL